MPNYRAHIAFSILLMLVLIALNYWAGELVNIKFSPVSVFLIVFVTAFYSILPDLDSPASKSRQIILMFGVIGLLFCFLYRYILYGIAICLILLGIFLLKHRGIAHSLVAGVVLSLFLWEIGPVYVLIAFIAYASHLFLDGRVKVV